MRGEKRETAAFTDCAACIAMVEKLVSLRAARVARIGSGSNRNASPPAGRRADTSDATS